MTHTSTVDISVLFAKALSLETMMERQDLLNKYVDEQVRGQGIVKQISRSGGGGGFLVDIIEGVNNRIITCPQDGTEENEKKLLLLKGKAIGFTGTFTYRRTFEHGLLIDDCVLLE